MTDRGGSAPAVEPGALGAVVVHWRDEAGLAELLEAWPDFERFPLVVVDNSGTLDAGDLPAGVIHESPGRNLGFGGGVDHGVQALGRGRDWEWVLVLNPDAAPEPGAIKALAGACRHWRQRDPKTVGLAPRLLEPEDGARHPSTQHRWQLQPLPSPLTLIAHIFFFAAQRGPAAEPPDGATVEQPAAAVLALHRSALDVRGRLFDAGYFPAWFDDVDLARRLHGAGRRLRYSHAASFRHGRGGSVPALGYGRFLWIYLRNLERYLRKHHGPVWRLARFVMPMSMLLRLGLLPLRRPRRAESRRQAAAGLLAVIVGALSGWRYPRPWARDFTAPTAPDGDADA